ncbi:MAG: hypothetical protein ACRDPA_00880 [Solirubrobacteraceae bacterium]
MPSTPALTYARRHHLAKPELARCAASVSHGSNYEWRLRKHLLPFFCDYAISEIDVALVEGYREQKVIERERVAEAIAAGEPLRDRRGSVGCR